MAVNLPKQLYTRGKQGTLVYSPDIAVFVKLTNDEILDLSPYLVDFNLSRVVNDVSTFTCSIDNRYGQFDRVIKRMDRIVVYLKRISWLQIFSGYVTTIPWQTVVPGNVTIAAECSLKRLVHNYFDQNTYEGMSFFPAFNQDTDFNLPDGGAARTIVRLLTEIVKWPVENIQVQKIPPRWSEDAAFVIQALIKEGDGDPQFQSDLQQIKDGLNAIIDAFGWRGYFSNDGQSIIDSWANGNPTGPAKEYTESNWQSLVAQSSNKDNGYIVGSYLFNLKSKGLDVKGDKEPKGNSQDTVFDIYLRLDAAESLSQLVSEWIDKGKDVQKVDNTIVVPITSAYLSFNDQDQYIHARNGGCTNGSFDTSFGGVEAPAEERFSIENSSKEVHNAYIYLKDLDSKGLGKEHSVGLDFWNENNKYEQNIKILQTWEAERLGLTYKPRYVSTVSGPATIARTLFHAFYGNDPDGEYWFYSNISRTEQQAYWLGYPDYKFVAGDNSSITFQTKGEFSTINTNVNQPKYSDITITSLSINIDGAQKIRCRSDGKGGVSVLGWATAIAVDPSTEFGKFITQDRMKKYGWYQAPVHTEGNNIWIFKGNDNFPIYWDHKGRIDKAGLTTDPGSLNDVDLQKYTGPYQNQAGQTSLKMDNNGASALFSIAYMGSNMFLDPLSGFLIGERSWINDVPVMDVIKQVCPASMRDFMSAPNGDFISFVPDRLGKYGNFPTVQIRDIELLDFKAIASDANLFTHYLSNSDVQVPYQQLDQLTSIYMTSAMMTVEQGPLMNFVLGLPLDQVDQDYGHRILEAFGLRPRVEDNKFIRNRAFNFVYALHKFQEMWANQWQFVVNLTFMPEVYPGMRIELVDRVLADGTPAPVAVYVESVTHSGSRTTGFNTTLTVSTPMFKLNGQWTHYRPEFGPILLPDTIDDVNQIAKITQRNINWYRENKNMIENT